MDAQNIFSGPLKEVLIDGVSYAMTDAVAEITITPVDGMINTGENAGKYSTGNATIELAEVDQATVAAMEVLRETETPVDLVLLDGYIAPDNYRAWRIKPLIYSVEIQRSFGSDLQRVILTASKFVQTQNDFCELITVTPPPLRGK